MSIGPGKNPEFDGEGASKDIMNGGQENLQVEARLTAERRLAQKLDTRVLPTVVAIYLMNYIDRAALASARLQGLQTDLGLSDVQYDTVVAIFFVSYSLSQIPSNVALNYLLRPSIYISTCVILWGLASALTGVTQNFTGIMACRVFIGLPEAAFFPGAMYILSSWYTRKELASRSAILFSGVLIANAFGNLWAAGIFSTMNGARGIAAWRWLFYIDGAVTMFIGFLAMLLLPDHPTNTRWLTASERHLAQVRIAEDVGEVDKDSQRASIFDGLKLALKDSKVLIFMSICFSQLLGLSFSNFFPTLIATLGYSTTNTLLMAAPPWVFAAIVAIASAYHADVTKERFFHQTAWWWVVMVGYTISLSTMDTSWRYISMFLMTCGDCGFVITMVWVANTIPRPPAKRSAAIGLVNGFGNLGNLAGSYIWKSSWGPGYHQSMIIAVCALALASILSFLIRVLLVRENKRMEYREQDMHGSERERIEEAARLEGIAFGDAMRRRIEFRYLY